MTLLPTRTAPLTLSDTLMRSFGKVSTIAAVAFAVSYLPAQMNVDTGAAPSRVLDETSSVDRLIAENDCWTGDAPADVDIPGHVVVDTGGVVPELKGAHYVALAFEQVFDGVDHGFKVLAFCR